MQKVKLSTNVLFSGLGQQERGIKDTGLFDLDVICTSDIDKDVMVSYAAIHNGLTNELIENYPGYPSREQMAQDLLDRNIGFDFKKNKPYDWAKLARRKSKDIEKYWLAMKLSNNLGDISGIKELPYADLWTCSFPCFTADTLVLTSNRGYVKIKDITTSDSVLAHDNQYHKVLKSMPTGEKEIWHINAMNNDGVNCTANHQFYVRTRHRVNTHQNGKAVNYRWFDKPIWKRCDELTKDDYLGYAINQNSIIPQWEDDTNPRIKIKLSQFMNSEDFWWIIGRYIADGFKQTSKTGSSIILCCGKPKVNEGLIEEHLLKIGLHYCTDDHKSCVNYHICSNELYRFVTQFGDKAHGKFIPSFVFDMPVNLCKAFLDGYLSGDGCFTNNQFKATSVSRELMYGIGQLIAKIYHRPFSIYHTKRKPQTIIEGRIVNQKDSYSIAYKQTSDIQDKAFYEDGYIWFPINKITNTHEVKPVYDITVDSAHSFTANGNIVHNCQAISVAGNQGGLTEGSGTTSSLVWEQIRLLKSSISKGESPKYILFENVKNLVSKKFMPEFEKLIAILDELGFNTYYDVLNAKNCGIPQNRERVFAICIRKDIDTGKMTFPKPFDNGLRLKDMLDDKVDEKYYINNDKADKLINELIENGTLENPNDYPVASRGRYTDDNSTEQNLEVRDETVANAITTVQKDSMCLKCSAPSRVSR